MRHVLDTFDTILAIANTNGCAPPTRIAMRNPTFRRCVIEVRKRCPEAAGRYDDDEVLLTRLAGIPVLEDNTVPFFPGFQIHREVW